MKRIISKKLHEQRFVHILIAFTLLCLPLFIDHNKFWEYHRSLYNFDLADEDDLFENHVTAGKLKGNCPFALITVQIITKFACPFELQSSNSKSGAFNFTR
jgi:hypothetical protein